MLLFKGELLFIFLFIHPLSSAYSIEGSVSGDIESMVISEKHYYGLGNEQHMPSLNLIFRF